MQTFISCVRPCDFRSQRLLLIACALLAGVTWPQEANLAAAQVNGPALQAPADAEEELREAERRQLPLPGDEEGPAADAIPPEVDAELREADRLQLPLPGDDESSVEAPMVSPGDRVLVEPPTDEPAEEAPAGPYINEEPSNCGRKVLPSEGAQLWLISARCAPMCCPDVNALRYYRCDSNCQWRETTLKEFLASELPGVPTQIYVHGNRVSRGQAFYRAWHIYHQIGNATPMGQPFRFVMWSWPSERTSRRQRPDVQEKARRSDAHVYYLAWVANQIGPEVPVGLFGFSYGARMITGALHMLAGGRICGRGLDEVLHPGRIPPRAVLMAAAMPNYWPLPGSRHGMAVTQVDRMLILINRQDTALRWYPYLDRLLGGGPEALGYTGLPGRYRLGLYNERVDQLDVTRMVGRTHDWSTYAGSYAMMRRIVPYLFYTEAY